MSLPTTINDRERVEILNDVEIVRRFRIYISKDQLYLSVHPHSPME